MQHTQLHNIDMTVDTGVVIVLQLPVDNTTLLYYNDEIENAN